MRVDLNHSHDISEEKQELSNFLSLAFIVLEETGKYYLDSTSYFLIDEILPVVDSSIVWPKG